MNMIEELVTILPPRHKKRIDELDCDFCTGNCESLDVISDYIMELESAMREFVERVDNGEVRSKRTYKNFRRILEEF